MLLLRQMRIPVPPFPYKRRAWGSNPSTRKFLITRFPAGHVTIGIRTSYNIDHGRGLCSPRLRAHTMVSPFPGYRTRRAQRRRIYSPARLLSGIERVTSGPCGALSRISALKGPRPVQTMGHVFSAPRGDRTLIWILPTRFWAWPVFHLRHGRICIVLLAGVEPAVVLDFPARILSPAHIPNSATEAYYKYPQRDSNSHAIRQRGLNPMRFPFTPWGHSAACRGRTCSPLSGALAFEAVPLPFWHCSMSVD